MNNATTDPGSNPFKLLIDTKDLWLPALTWIIGQLSASKPGIKIDDWSRTKLKWLKDPEAEKAFHNSFNSAIKRYERERGQSTTAIAVANVLLHTAEHDVTGLDRAIILRQIFAPHPKPEVLADTVKRYSFAIKGMFVDINEVTAELQILIEKYLKPEFLAHPFFTERVGFAEIIGLLEEISIAITGPQPDLESLRLDYLKKTATKYEYITMQGISPKVQNRTVGLRIEDIFITLKVDLDISHSSFYRKIVDRFTEYQVSLEKYIVESTEFKKLENSLPFDDARIDVVFPRWFDINLSVNNVKINRNLIKTLKKYRELKNHDLLELNEFDLGQEDLKEFGYIPLLSQPFVINDLLTFPRIVIKGDPGSGKSTLMRYICWAIASEKTQLVGEEIINMIPLRIRAIEFGDALEKGRVESLEEYLMKEAGRFAPLFKRSLVVGKTLVLVDGLDEVGELTLRVKVKEKVDDFLADPILSDNHMILTTRIVGYEPGGIIGKFPHFMLVELDDEQIGGFVENWYRAIHREMPSGINVEEERKQLMDAITGNESIRRMAGNPLLLTIIALIKWQGRLLPEQRVLLYDAAAQTLIRSWPLSQRRVEFDELFVREWLAPVALHIMENRTTDLLDEFTLMDDLIASMLRLKSMSEFDARRASQELLESITFHSGILLPRGTDSDGRNLYGFLHQTFAEYLSAYFLAGRWEDGDLNLIDFAHDPYWREVLLLIAGHLGTNRRAKAGQFIKAIRNLNSSRYEEFINRDLLLAIRILEDGVPVGPGDLVEALLGEFLELWIDTPINALKADIDKAIAGLRGTEYLSVFLRLASGKKLSDDRVIKLAQLLGVEYFHNLLVKLLDADDQEIRLLSAELLVDKGNERSLNVLVSLIDSQIFLRERAAKLLLSNGDPRGVRPFLESSNRVRYKSQGKVPLQLLEQAIEKYPNIKERVIELLSDPDPKIALKLAAMLANSHKEIVEAVLGKFLKSDNSETRFKAASILFDLNPTKAIETLYALLDEKDPWIQFQVCKFLIQHRDPRGKEILTKIKDPSIRYPAAVILYKDNNPSGVDMLMQLLQEEDTFIRLRSAIFLAEEGYVDGIRILLKLLDNENPEIRLDAAQTLANNKDPRGYESIIKLLEEKDQEIRLRAAEFLAEHQDIQCISTLIDILNVGGPWLRYKAAITLSGLKHPSAFKAIISVLPKMMEDHETVYLGLDSVSSVAYRYIAENLSPSGDLIAPKQSEKPKRNTGREYNVVF